MTLKYSIWCGCLLDKWELLMEIQKVIPDPLIRYLPLYFENVEQDLFTRGKSTLLATFYSLNIFI